MELAVRIGVPDNRIYQIINGKRDITADTALRLGQFFGTGADLWINLQKAYELDVAKGKIGNSLKTIIPVERQTGNGADHTPTKP